MKTSLIFVRVVIYFLAISALSLIGCAETAKNVDNAEKNDSLRKGTEATINAIVEKEKQYYEKECEVLKMYLDDKHYVYPTREEFKKRCSEYWGIDVDTVPYVYNHGEDQVFTDCMIIKHGPESVYYYPGYEAQIKGEPKGDAEEAFAAMKYADDSLDYYYNQLLFHDDIRALPIFLNNPEYAYNVVYYHNYEKNKLLFQKAVAQYSWPEYNRDWEKLRYTLFYNNLDRGVRKDFIKNITHFKEEKPENYTHMEQTPEFYNFIDMFICVYDYIEVPIELKDECLCYMILLLHDFCEDFNAKRPDSCGDAYGAYDCVETMVSMHGYDFIERVRRNNYYNSQSLKEIIKEGMVKNLPFHHYGRDGELDGGSVILYGRVDDNDGYVNLREKADLKSNVIGTISNGEDVKIIDMTQEDIEFSQMLKVKTKDGRIGHVHKSRLRLYEMHTDKSRKSILESYRLPYIKEYEW